MTTSETKQFMERIKTYYPTFVIDDFTIKEWHSQLKEYNTQDINEKFNEHLKSEQYGDYIPKLNYLTKYLIKEQDKGVTHKYTILCSICGKKVTSDEIDKHYDRCRSIDYLMRNSEKYFGKKLNREKLEQANEEIFKNYYWDFCKKLLPLVNDNMVFRKSLENKLSLHYDNQQKYEYRDILE